jgi:transmembrane sensor
VIRQWIRALRADAARRAGRVGVDANEACHDECDDFDATGAMSDEMPWEVLVRYGAGDATSDELAALASWRAESAEHAELLRRIARLASLSRAADALSHTDAGWERLQHRMEGSTVKPGEPRVLPVRRVRFAPTSAAGARSPSRTRTAIGLAAAAVIAVGVTAWTLRPAPEVAMQTVTAPRGERLDFGLPDGSHVVLGAESRLRFASEGFDSNRALYLEGQGFFAVAHDTKHPFVVHARGTSVQAVGTAFGVRAFPEDSAVEVAVVTGRVLVRDERIPGSKGAEIDVGDMARMDSAGQMTITRDANIEMALGWVRGRLIYDMAPASTVVRDLERWYDVTIQIDSTAQRSDLRVTMTIDPTEPAPVSMQRFAEVMNMRMVPSGNAVRLIPRAPPPHKGSEHAP